jgi:pantetheine-phosphate adenylyltransferase
MMKACYPGTFDPITNGHLDIIERAARIFDEVDVLIMVNPNKQCVFTEEERREMIEECLRVLPGMKNVKVMIGSGLTVHYARRIGACAIVRGIRAVSDYEYELRQATANQTLDDTIETLFFIARPTYSFLSSSVVREIAANQGDISGMVPEPIRGRVLKKFQK